MGINCCGWNKRNKNEERLDEINMDENIIIRTEFEQNEEPESPRKVRPWDLLHKENYTDQDIAAARMEVCMACPQLSAKKFCGFCHCYMPSKTKLRAAYCPVRLW